MPLFFLLMILIKYISIMKVAMPPRSAQKRVSTQPIPQGSAFQSDDSCVKMPAAFKIKAKPVLKNIARSWTSNKQAGQPMTFDSPLSQSTQKSRVSKNPSFVISKRIQTNTDIPKIQAASIGKANRKLHKADSRHRYGRTPEKGQRIVESYDYLTCQGNRDYNQDRVLIQNNVVVDQKNMSVFAVFDGHGGASAAEFLKIYFIKVLESCNLKKAHSRSGLDNLDSSADRIKSILKEALMEVEAKVIQSNSKITSGSCATICLISEDGFYYTANIGDSRMLIVDKDGDTDQITEDHKPENPSQKERILRMGGQIYRSSIVDPSNGQKMYGPWRAVPGKLSVSRTIGDSLIKKAKKGVISAEPEMFHGKVPQNALILLMTDGAYEKVQNFQFSLFFSPSKSINQQLLKFAEVLKKRNTNDNTSIIVIKTRNTSLSSSLTKDSLQLTNSSIKLS